MLAALPALGLIVLCFLAWKLPKWQDNARYKKGPNYSGSRDPRPPSSEG